MNACADADTETLRISIDTKATVNVGDYSRGGQSRGRSAVAAWDHDMRSGNDNRKLTTCDNRILTTQSSVYTLG